MSRYLVTGATGFLGSHLVATLAARGHDVVSFARSADGKPSPRVVVRKGDVLDAASVTDAAAGCDGVFHCAGKVSRKPEDAEELHRLHVMGTRTVLEACKAAGVHRAVVASTSGTVAVSTDPTFVATEEDETPIALIQRWPYYRSKLFAERAALAMNEAGFEVVSVNPSLLLGPGDLRGSSTEDVRLFLERKVPAVPAGGVAYVDVRDAAIAMCLAMDKGEPGQRYLVSASNVTVRELFARLERVSGVRAPVLAMPRSRELSSAALVLGQRVATRLGLSLPVDPASVDMAQHYWYVDSSRAEQVLGFTSRDPIDTLKDTVDDLRVRGVVWPRDDEAS